MKTQMDAAHIPTSTGAVAEVSARERYLSPDEAAQYLNVSVGFIRRMASERRVRHYRLGKFIRFDPADSSLPLSGPDPTWLHKCGDGVGGLADDQPPLLRFDPQARVRTVADPLPHLRRCLSGLARDLRPPSRRGQSISGAGTAVAGRWQLAGCRRQQSFVRRVRR